MKLDLRGLDCPEPVIRTKKELDKANVNEVTSVVDNEVARENLRKLGESLNCKVVAKEVGSDFEVTITKDGEAHSTDGKGTFINGDSVILFKQNFFGSDKELGKILIKSFIYTVLESGNLPDKMLFVNEGVKLVCEEGDILEDLKKLESNGVKVAACGLCLDFFKLKESVKVGTITNMYDIYTTVKNAGHLIEI